MRRREVQGAASHEQPFHSLTSLNPPTGHESNAELLLSYGFVPPRSRTDAVALYEEPQGLIDDDRWVPRSSIKSRRLKVRAKRS